MDLGPLRLVFPVVSEKLRSCTFSIFATCEISTIAETTCYQLKIFNFPFCFYHDFVHESEALVDFCWRRWTSLALKWKPNLRIQTIVCVDHWLLWRGQNQPAWHPCSSCSPEEGFQASNLGGQCSSCDNMR